VDGPKKNWLGRGRKKKGPTATAENSGEKFFLGRGGAGGPAGPGGARGGGGTVLQWEGGSLTPLKKALDQGGGAGSLRLGGRVDQGIGRDCREKSNGGPRTGRKEKKKIWRVFFAGGVGETRSSTGSWGKGGKGNWPPGGGGGLISVRP